MYDAVELAEELVEAEMMVTCVPVLNSDDEQDVAVVALEAERLRLPPADKPRQRAANQGGGCRGHSFASPTSTAGAEVPVPFIFIDEEQRQWLERFAEANKGPAWLLEAIRREDPKRRGLPVTYWRGRQK